MMKFHLANAVRNKSTCHQHLGDLHAAYTQCEKAVNLMENLIKENGFTWLRLGMAGFKVTLPAIRISGVNANKLKTVC
jgi:hypothetical protein